jgi:hypothetical protein
MFDQKGGQITEYRAIKERIKEGLANNKKDLENLPQIKRTNQ